MTGTEISTAWLGSWDNANSTDPHAEALERAEVATRLLRDLVPCAAYALSAFDPLSGSHVHRDLGSQGYSPETMAHINDGYVKENPAFRLLHSRVPHALRWRDLKRNWELDFSRTVIAEEFLLPEGIREGTTACLRLPHGRYTGALHVSWASANSATDDRRETIERLRPVFAMVCDMLGAPKLVAETLAPGARAIAVARNGSTTALAGEIAASQLADGSSLRATLTHVRLDQKHRFLWRGPTSWHRVNIIPCQGGGAVIAEEAIDPPYGLTVRELEILHHVSRGRSNPEIGEELFVSPRTVSTHVEHILAKMGCSSRAELAAIAVTEGLHLAASPAVPATR